MKNCNLKSILDYIKIPRDEIITCEISSNANSKPIISIEANYSPSYLLKNELKTENKGDKNMDKIDNLLEIYRKKSMAKIDFDCDNDIKFIRETSDLYLMLEKLRKQAEEEFCKIYPNIDNPQDYFYINIKATPQIDEQVERRIQERDEEIDRLNKIIEEAKSLLAIADLFEEKMDILKSYEIVDEIGRIKEW